MAGEGHARSGRTILNGDARFADELASCAVDDVHLIDRRQLTSAMEL
jgi:hypothetical protein